MTRRVGLFGGSFDPPHNTHVALARLARDHLRLDELKLVPAGDPWQKAGRRMAPAPQRAEMARLAVAGERGITVDDIELQRTGPSYTVDTVEALRQRPGEQGTEWFLVIGQDQYARFHTWHRWQDLLGQVTLAVAGRAGEAPRPGPELAAVPHRVTILPLPPSPLSASDVRARLARRESISEVVPPAVARYIDQAHLYKN